MSYELLDFRPEGIRVDQSLAENTFDAYNEVIAMHNETGIGIRRPLQIGESYDVTPRIASGDVTTLTILHVLSSRRVAVSMLPNSTDEALLMIDGESHDKSLITHQSRRELPVKSPVVIGDDERVYVIAFYLPARREQR